VFPARPAPSSEGGYFVLLALWSPKGGSGTSVVAAALALVAAGRGETRLADMAGDQPAILGIVPPLASMATLVDWLAAAPATPTEWLDDMALPVVPGLSLVPGGPVTQAASPEAGAALAVALRDSGIAVVDLGSGADEFDGAGRAVIDVADTALVVVRPCYLALRRAVADPRVASSAGAILVEEPGRALDADDVSAVLGVPVVGRFPVRAEIARAVDAGVLRDRLPAPLANAAGVVLDRLAKLAGGCWAA
jgi:MinD-like ATPase involved in chromosome partitioning or flagellar assembly